MSQDCPTRTATKAAIAWEPPIRLLWLLKPSADPCYVFGAVLLLAGVAAVVLAGLADPRLLTMDPTTAAPQAAASDLSILAAAMVGSHAHWLSGAGGLVCNVGLVLMVLYNFRKREKGEGLP